MTFQPTPDVEERLPRAIRKQYKIENGDLPRVRSYVINQAIRNYLDALQKEIGPFERLAA